MSTMTLDRARSLHPALAVALVLALPSTVPVRGADFIRGDADGSGVVELTDAVYVLEHLFRGGAAPACLDAADSNDDGDNDLSDAVFTLQALFTGESELPAPGLSCGSDPTDDGLGCDASPCAGCPPPTERQTEGPYFKPGSPERSSLIEEGVEGTRLLLSGRVLSSGDCAAIEDARVDFWHADASGAYDNAGFRLRGHQLTVEGGRYELETIVPGLYPGRTRHIHVKVTPPGGSVLTTQLYFPGEPQNATDGIYDEDLEIAIADGPEGKTGRFDFVVEAD